MIGSSRVGTEKGHLAAEIEGKDMLRKHIYENRIEPALHTPQLHKKGIRGIAAKKAPVIKKAPPLVVFRFSTRGGLS